MSNISYVEMALPRSGGKKEFFLRDYWGVKGGDVFYDFNTYSISVKYLTNSLYHIVVNTKDGWLGDAQTIKEELVVSGKKGTFRLNIFLTEEFVVNEGETINVMVDDNTLPFTVTWPKTAKHITNGKNITKNCCGVYCYTKDEEFGDITTFNLRRDVGTDYYNDYYGDEEEDNIESSIIAYDDNNNNVVGRINFN